MSQNRVKSSGQGGSGASFWGAGYAQTVLHFIQWPCDKLHSQDPVDVGVHVV